MISFATVGAITCVLVKYRGDMYVHAVLDLLCQARVCIALGGAVQLCTQLACSRASSVVFVEGSKSRLCTPELSPSRVCVRHNQTRHASYLSALILPGLGLVLNGESTYRLRLFLWPLTLALALSGLRWWRRTHFADHASVGAYSLLLYRVSQE